MTIHNTADGDDKVPDNPEPLHLVTPAQWADATGTPAKASAPAAAKRAKPSGGSKYFSWLDRELRPEEKLAIVAFPITLYMLLGTLLLYSVYQLERLSRTLAAYHKFEEWFEQIVKDEHRLVVLLVVHMLSPLWMPLVLISPVTARQWHKRSLLLTVCFPVTFPALACIAIYILATNTLVAVVRACSVVTKDVWRVVQRLCAGQDQGRKSRRPSLRIVPSQSTTTDDNRPSTA